MYKIWKYVREGVQEDEEQIPFDINYKTGLTIRLHPMRTFVKGVLIEVCYHLNASKNSDGSVSYDEPIIREQFEYVRDAATFAQSRIQTIEWYDENGEIGPDKKELVKVYEPVEGITEGVRRRTNVIDQLKIDLIGLALGTGNAANVPVAIGLGREIFDQLVKEIQAYIETNDFALATALQNVDLFPWLNSIIPGTPITVRAYILDAIDF